MTIKKCLDDLNDLGLKKDTIMAEGVAMHENLNAVEDLMKVVQNAADKNAVFESFKKRYEAHFAQSDEIEQQR